MLTFEGCGTPAAGMSEMEVSIDGGSVLIRIDADGSPARIYLARNQCAELGKYLSAAAIVLPK